MTRGWAAVTEACCCPFPSSIHLCDSPSALLESRPGVAWQCDLSVLRPLPLAAPRAPRVSSSPALAADVHPCFFMRLLLEDPEGKHPAASGPAATFLLLSITSKTWSVLLMPVTLSLLSLLPRWILSLSFSPLGHTVGARGMLLVPQPGTEPLHWRGRVLTLGPPRKSHRQILSHSVSPFVQFPMQPNQAWPRPIHKCHQR